MKHLEVLPHPTKESETTTGLRQLPEAANDNDLKPEKVTVDVPGAANDNIISESDPEAGELAEVRERLGISLESSLTNPVSSQIETEAAQKAGVRAESATTDAKKDPQPASASAGAGSSGGKGSGEGSGKGKNLGSQSTLVAAKVEGGKFFKVLKGIGKLIGFIIGAPIALAFKGMHWATGKIMKSAGAK